MYYNLFLVHGLKIFSFFAPTCGVRLCYNNDLPRALLYYYYYYCHRRHLNIITACAPTTTTTTMTPHDRIDRTSSAGLENRPESKESSSAVAVAVVEERGGIHISGGGREGMAGRMCREGPKVIYTLIPFAYMRPH